MGTLPAHVRSVYIPNPGATPGFRRPRPTTRRRHARAEVCRSHMPLSWLCSGSAQAAVAGLEGPPSSASSSMMTLP